LDVVVHGGGSGPDGVVRLGLLNFPLERDEGEYAYAGQLMLQGIPPYDLACNMKFPGTYAISIAILLGQGRRRSWEIERDGHGNLLAPAIRAELRHPAGQVKSRAGRRGNRH
jgi:hypothetical protein